MRTSCRVTRRSGENLGPKRSLICSIGDVFGGSTRFCVFSDLILRWTSLLRACVACVCCVRLLRQMTEPFHSPRQNYAILKKDARARATFWICSSIPRGGVVVVTPRGGGRMKVTPNWKDAHSLRGILPIEGLQNPARGLCIFPFCLWFLVIFKNFVVRSFVRFVVRSFVPSFQR